MPGGKIVEVIDRGKDGVRGAGDSLRAHALVVTTENRALSHLVRASRVNESATIPSGLGRGNIRKSSFCGMFLSDYNCTEKLQFRERLIWQLNTTQRLSSSF